MLVLWVRKSRNICRKLHVVWPSPSRVCSVYWTVKTLAMSLGPLVKARACGMTPGGVKLQTSRGLR
jgi:hypothetical protein